MTEDDFLDRSDTTPHTFWVRAGKIHKDVSNVGRVCESDSQEYKFRKKHMINQIFTMIEKFELENKIYLE